MKASLRAVTWWVVAPLASLFIGATLGHAFATRPNNASFEPPSSFTATDNALAEASVALAVAHVTWPYGKVEQIKQASRNAIQALPETAGPDRARLFLRIALVDDSPDGQRALLASACREDPSLCDGLAKAARREIDLRQVSPGNHLPLTLVGGHPPVSP
jgi:hypothetical protein